MSTAHVRLRIADGVATVVFDNPPLHVWNAAMTRGLTEALDTVESDPSVGVVILTGAGDRAFCAGSDIAEFAVLRAPGEAVAKKLRPQQELFARLASFPRPVIAALNGHTLGGGLEIAVCCDLIVAEEQIGIGSPEILLGVFPSSGGTFRVARRIGAGRAKEMQLLGEPVSAATALAWGLVNRVVERGGAVGAARELAEVLLRRPPRALALCKSVIDAAHDLPEEELIERSLAASDEAFTSAESAEGVRAFLAKRRPDFRDPPGSPAPHVRSVTHSVTRSVEKETHA
ncbi:enoyl-CoA hydratase/isomerase family protein [Streptomyces corynorhini]|uniref:Enoyl-CoA hydratase/isomerase family protein n=1 Tax=Streptomyces corynorhini TaxID=2282652 RepID=A0A370BA10_9ACTN|nr:enoyl-CoA hydratase-related protein [Streptomyces corynorhini]RDG36556.1 enoyl-CoA hydratase/isomerase family protein [Streptomyces corynorhini]